MDTPRLPDNTPDKTNPESPPDGGPVAIASPPVDVLTTRPMRTPPGSWGLLLTDLDTSSGTGPDVRPGAAAEPALLQMSGIWLPEPPGGRPEPPQHTGQIVIHPQESDLGAGADITAWMAVAGGWHLIGSWPGIGPDWPEHLAPTLAAVQTLSQFLITPDHPAHRS